MNAKMNAIAMTLLMIASALAGCTSGDPDGDGTSGIDMEILNEMIDDNLQDFINNTSVTINQEIHYHNNTTYIVDGGEVVNNNYDQSENSWNIGGASFGEGVNGTTSGGGMMFVTHLEFTGLDLFPDYEIPEDPQNNDFTYTYTYYDYMTNLDRTDTFTYPCSVFYVVGSQSSNNSSQVSFWQDSYNYHNAWEQMYNTTIADMLQEAAQTQSIQQVCNDQFTGIIPLADGKDGWNYNFLSIDIPEGYAIQYIQLEHSHRYFGCTNVLWDHQCTNSGNHYWRDTSIRYNYSMGESPHNEDYLFGGWDNLTIDFSFDFELYQYYEDNLFYGYGGYSVWPTSEYEFTLYYRFVPVVPVE
jgi:hypothetical protein